MIEIEVKGDIQSGKTTQLIDLANNKTSQGLRVLYVCPRKSQCAILKQYKELAHDVFTTGAADFSRVVRCAYFDVIIFDEIQFAGPTKEGDLFQIARSRLARLKFGCFAYSSPSIEYERLWVSTAKWWNPMTWRNGYWVIKEIKGDHHDK